MSDSSDEDDRGKNEEEDSSGGESASGGDSSAEETAAPSRKRRASKGKQKGSSKKTKHLPRLLDDEAEDDEGSGSDVERGEAAELTALEKAAHERIRKRQQNEIQFREGRSAEEIAADYERRAGGGPRRTRGDDFKSSDEGEEEDEDMDDMDEGHSIVGRDQAQQSLLPSITDPKLFRMRCKNGHEQTVVLSLMLKAIDFIKSGKPMSVKSAVAAPVKGSIYLEADNEPDIRKITQGLSLLFHGSLQLVPLNDMANVLTVKNAPRPINEGQYVRLKRMPYKDDLAYVDSVVNFGEKALVRFIPRIDLTTIGLSRDEKRARKGMRPNQRWFDKVEVTKMKGVVERKRLPSTGTTVDCFDNMYFRNGYAVKEVSVATQIRTHDINPTLEELTKFTSRQRDEYDEYGSDEEDMPKKTKPQTPQELLTELKAIQAKSGPAVAEVPHFFVGETVVVTSGDLKDLAGKIVEVLGSGAEMVLKMVPSAEELASEIIEVHPSQVAKFFRVGAHVRAIDGHFTGDTGTIVSVQEMNGDQVAVVLSDMSAKEMQVRVAHLTETLEVAQGLDSLQGIELYDLLVLGPTEVAVVTGVGREDLEVITSSGSTKRIRPEESRGNRSHQSSHSIALDAEQNQLRVGDLVTVVEGKHVRMSGTIKHIHRAILFVHNRTHQQHSGIFVVRARSCVMTNNKRGGEKHAPAIGYMGAVGAQKKDNIIKDYRNRNDELLGKTVTIIKGMYKGYLGIVTEATETHVKVEMAAKHKSITIERTSIREVGDRHGPLNGGTGVGNRFTAPGSRTPMILGSQTPVHSQATPMHGSMTPLHGSATPTHVTSTPTHNAWRPNAADDEQPNVTAYNTGANNGGYEDWNDGTANNNNSANRGGSGGYSNDGRWDSSSRTAYGSSPDTSTSHYRGDSPSSYSSALSPQGYGSNSSYSPQINSPASSHDGDAEEDRVIFEKSDRVRSTFGEHSGKEGKVTYIDKDTDDVHIKFKDGSKEILPGRDASRELEKI